MRRKAIEITNTWNKDLKIGDKLEGIYTRKDIVNGDYGQTAKYIIETPNGEVKGVFASASLARQFANIPEGAYVWIEYKGEQTSKNGRKVKIYDVEFDDEI